MSFPSPTGETGNDNTQVRALPHTVPLHSPAVLYDTRDIEVLWDLYSGEDFAESRDSNVRVLHFTTTIQHATHREAMCAFLEQFMSNESVIYTVLASPDILPNILTHFAGSPHEGVLRAIARNPSTPPEALTTVTHSSTHCDIYVARAVMNNPNTPPSTLAFLTTDDVPVYRNYHDLYGDDGAELLTLTQLQARQRLGEVRHRGGDV